MPPLLGDKEGVGFLSVPTEDPECVSGSRGQQWEPRPWVLTHSENCGQGHEVWVSGRPGADSQVTAVPGMWDP